MKPYISDTSDLTMFFASIGASVIFCAIPTMDTLFMSVATMAIFAFIVFGSELIMQD